MEIRELSALVTGASGFIGGRLAERLATEEGVRVRALVRNPKRAERLLKFQAEIVKGDLLDLSSLRKAVDGCDLVFHCAAFVRETGDRNEFIQTNIKGPVGSSSGGKASRRSDSARKCLWPLFQPMDNSSCEACQFRPDDIDQPGH